MSYSKEQLWQRFQQFYTEFPSLGLAVDLSRMNFAGDFLSSAGPAMRRAFGAMAKLEAGAIANPDEKRMVGHYWLRNPALAPTPEIRQEIEETLVAIKRFTGQIHSSQIQGAGGPFKSVLLIGIGGSALGPQFVANALGSPSGDKLNLYFLENTDPDGIDRVLERLRPDLGQTLCIAISKSGETKETRNGMVEAEAAYAKAGLKFGAHTVAITSKESKLDKYAIENRWLARFPMWDWVGGRTSELSAVGLLPAALQGIDIDSMIAGARDCDEITRNPEIMANPAAQLALMWLYAGNAKGSKNLIVLPYKDRLELFSKYLQQLIMESLGKRLDSDGKVVNQGLTVLGNKGSTDQHSYIQQLRDGLDNFFVTFIEVLKDRGGSSMAVEPGVTTGDYLSGFFQGTRTALYENGRQSITLTVSDVSAFRVGMLIALFERTVGFYASLININAYHQPGVQAGKVAATDVINLQGRTLHFLAEKSPSGFTASQIANAIGAADEVETIFKVCMHLAANPDRDVGMALGTAPTQRQFFYRRS